jgi:hypothetical protein
MAKLTLPELKLTREFLSLTPKAQAFVLAYLENGYNATQATLSAYDCKDEFTASKFAYQLMGRASIVVVLSLHFADSPEDAFLQHVWRLILKGRIDQATASAIRTYAAMLNLKGRHITTELFRNPASSKTSEPSHEPPAPVHDFLEEFTDPY